MKLRFLLLTTVLFGAEFCFSGETSGTVETWWNGPGVTGNWLGVRDTLEDHGFTLSGKWMGTVYGVVDGGLQQRATFDEELKFDVKLDFAKLTGWEALQGLTAVGGVRFRDGTDVNKYAGASSAFNPSAYQSGKQWRLMPFYLSYTTPELFGIRNFLTLSGGWQDPYEFFARQEDTKLFRNFAFYTKGISGNGLGWSSSYAAWGGTVKVAPNDWSYSQTGIYMAIPGATSTSNHGLDLEGAQPWNRNGWFIMSEMGVTPKIAGLPGKYAIGGYYWGMENTSFNGCKYDGKYGFYAMAEQTIYREPAPAVEVSGGKTGDGKSTVAASAPKASNQGLRVLGFVNYAPNYNNCLPLLFYTGLVYEGLIPSRDKDLTGIGFVFGDYSYNQIVSNREEGKSVVDTFEGALEFDYRVQLNKWGYIQPFVQYVIRPNADGEVPNATVLGVHFGVTF